MNKLIRIHGSQVGSRTNIRNQLDEKKLDHTAEKFTKRALKEMSNTT